MRKNGGFKRLLSFLGPGFLVTVGFIDPGNWATNLEGGSSFGYTLLWVITLSTLILIVVQNMAAKLGIATGKSLAVNIRGKIPRTRHRPAGAHGRPCLRGDGRGGASRRRDRLSASASACRFGWER